MIKLYKHQNQMISEAKPILEEFNMVYIAAETRTGKTLAAIHLLKDDYKSVLVVTKKKAISSWEDDLKLSKVNNFTVINYEAIHKLDCTTFDIIVLDESHSIGTYPKPSERAKKIKVIAKDKRIVYLSATPSAETYSQLFHQFWVSSYSPFDEVSFYKWYQYYGVVERVMIQGRMINKYNNAIEYLVLPKIEHLIVKMTKQKANFDVIVQEQLHQVEANENYINAIKYFERNRVLNIGDYDVVAETPPSVLNKTHQLCGGTIKIDDSVSLIVSDHKVKYILKNFDHSSKLVVLCNYVKERDLLLRALPNSTDDVNKFKAGPYNYFVGHIKTFSEGVDFSYSDSMIIYSLNFSATTYLQARERLANKKRTKPITVHYLFTKDTLDQDIYEAVRNKMNFTSRYYRGIQ